MDKLLFFSKEEILTEGLVITIAKVWGVLNSTTLCELCEKLTNLHERGFAYIALKLSDIENRLGDDLLFNNMLRELQEAGTQIMVIDPPSSLYICHDTAVCQDDRQAIALFCSRLLPRKIFISQIETPQGIPVTVARIPNGFDGNDACKLEEIVEEITAQGGRYLIVDFSLLLRTGSTGLGVLVKIADHFQMIGGNVSLVGLPEKVIALFDMLGLLSFFKMHDTVEDAAASFTVS